MALAVAWSSIAWRPAAGVARFIAAGRVKSFSGLKVAILIIDGLPSVRASTPLARPLGHDLDGLTGGDAVVHGESPERAHDRPIAHGGPPSRRGVEELLDAFRPTMHLVVHVNAVDRGVAAFDRPGFER